MFWSKLAREYELQRELDGYAAEIEEMIEIAAANERRAFAECQLIEWDYWRTRKRHLQEFGGKVLDHARGDGDYWLRAIRSLGGYRRPQPYGRFITRDDNGQPRTDPHHKTGEIFWQPDDWYVPDADPQPEPGHAKPFRVQIWRSSEWVDVQSFEDRAAAETFANAISDTKTRIKEARA